MNDYSIILHKRSAKEVQVVAETREEAQRIALQQDDGSGYVSHATETEVVCWTPLRADPPQDQGSERGISANSRADEDMREG